MMTPKPTKRNKELTGEYIKPITPAIPHSDFPASGSGDAAPLTTNEANTDQALDTIPVKPIKNPTEATDKFTEPITPTTSQGDNLEAGINDTTSLKTIEEEIHNLQTQTGSTDEVWQSQRNPKRKWGFNNEELTTMTTSQGDICTSVENDYSPIFGVQVGTDTYVRRTELGTGHTPPKKYKKPKSGSPGQKNQPPNSPYKGRRRPS